VNPATIFIVVDFPAPFGPRKPTISFLATVKERSASTRMRLRQKPVG
jgi:hypothetical protein